MTDPSSLTTVPDEARGKRTFAGILIVVCLLSVVALGFAMIRTFTRERPLDEIARTHFQWDYRFDITHATDDVTRAQAWFKPTNPKMKPGDGVQALYIMNPVGLGLVPPTVAKSGASKPLRLVSKNPGGETFGVEYDTKRRLYHLWWQGAP